LSSGAGWFFSIQIRRVIPNTLSVAPSPEDKPTFDAAYAEIARQVRKLARWLAMAGHTEIEETLVQDALADLAATWSTYDPATPLRSWVWGCVRRAAARWLRLPVGGEVPEREIDAVTFTPEERTLAEARYRELIELLRPMDEDRRIVFELRELDGFTLHEIAELLGISIARAHLRLRAAWTEIEERLRAEGGARERLGIERRRAGRGRLSFS